ncbi:unnamed protein product, partial [Thlaspi arvense]
MKTAENWRYAAKQLLKKYPQDVIVHCSESNSSTLTFQGVDKMGSRLADEVVSVIKRYPGLQKISFIGHSLGGLIARFAIAKLYSEGDGECRHDEFKGRIAGLEPMNFITSATPILDQGVINSANIIFLPYSRGVCSWKGLLAPAFCGSYTLEKAAARASWLLGRSGKHLFLKDGNKKKPPLLLKMASDSDDLKFISALQSFRHRVAYSNTLLVGRSTSSLRRRSELPKRKTLSRSDKYPHVINVEYAKAADTREETCLDPKVNRFKTTNMEEAMIRGLTKMSWEKVDVDFGGSKQRFWAHNTIQATQNATMIMCDVNVNSYRMNSDGADVIQHMESEDMSKLGKQLELPNCTLCHIRMPHGHHIMLQSSDHRQFDGKWQAYLKAPLYRLLTPESISQKAVQTIM